MGNRSFAEKLDAYHIHQACIDFFFFCDDRTMNIFLQSSTTESSVFHRYVEISGYN
jgi:hypothetical protein